MAIELNHTIVPAKDKRASAEFLAGVLGLKAGAPWGPFVPVELANGVALDFMDASEFRELHFAFLVSEPEFDAAFERIQRARTPYYADPHRERRGEINHHDGGRGVYFKDPDGHLLEAITRPYGSGG